MALSAFDNYSVEVWFGNEGYIQVEFQNEAVVDKTFEHTRKKVQSPLANLLWRAKRQWRKWYPE